MNKDTTPNKIFFVNGIKKNKPWTFRIGKIYGTAEQVQDRIDQYLEHNCDKWSRVFARDSEETLEINATIRI